VRSTPSTHHPNASTGHISCRIPNRERQACQCRVKIVYMRESLDREIQNYGPGSRSPAYFDGVAAVASSPSALYFSSIGFGYLSL